MRRRGTPGLTHTHTNAGQQELDEIAGQTTGQGTGTPHTHSDGNDLDPIGPLGQPGNRQSQHRVEQRKGQPCQHAQLPVSQTEIELDRLGQDIDHLAIEKIEHIDHQQHAKGIPSRTLG